MNKAIEIISREHQTQKTVSLGNSANSSLKLTESSVVQMQASPADIMSYERVGDDLVLHMKDGSTIDYSEFFLEDAAGKHSELVLSEAGKQPVHVAFDEAAMADASAQGGATELAAEFEPMANTDSLLAKSAGAAGGLLATLVGAGIATAAIGGAAIAIHNNNKDDNDHDRESDTPSIVVNPITGDDVITNKEAADGVTIDGTTTPGADVVVVVDGKEFPAIADDNGKWAVEVPAEVLDGAGGADRIKVIVTEPDGDKAEIDHPVIIGTDEVPITVNPITGDDVITNKEAADGVTIDGTTTPGADVVVVVDGQEFPATAGDNGEWAVEVPAEVLDEAGGADSITVIVTEPDGDTAAIDHPVIIGTDDMTITVNPITGDDAVNAREAADGVTIDGSSSAPGAGCEVVVRIGGEEFKTLTDENGDWSVDVPAEVWNGLDGEANIVVVMTNETGNTGAVDHTVTVDTKGPEVTVNPITGDDVVNAGEAKAGVTIDGSSSAPGAGCEVVVRIGGEEFKTQTDENGDWSVDVPAEVWNGLDGATDVVVVMTNESGNVTEVDHAVTVDTGKPLLTLDIVAGDDIVNALEAATGVPISGTASAGAEIVVKLGDDELVTVADDKGHWSVKVLPEQLELLDGDISVEVTATDKSGNTNSIDHQIKVDLDGPLLTIDTVAVDDVINAVEALTGVPISGTATAGAEIVVKLGDDELVTVADDKGHWSVKVLPEQLELLDGDISVEVIATDKSGNTNSIDHQIKVDLDGPLLTIDTVAADDVINAVEALAGVAITGTATAGSSIVVKLAGEELLAVADEQGHWSVTVLPDVLNALDGEVNVEVIATDEAGNTESLDHLIHVDVGLPNLTIDTVAGDDLINATEALAGVTINGTATAGSSIVVKLAGEELVVVADETGHWSVNVLPGVLNALDGEVNVEVIATDEAGNTESLDHLITVDTGVPTVAIDAISGDGVISAAEVAAGIAITGIATAGSKVVLSIGGEDYNVTVGDDGKWSVNVPATVWDNVYGEVVVKAVASDEAGNTADASRSITVETPALTISTVAGDDIINAAEHGEGLEISGTSGGLEAGQILNIELNGKAYTVEIGANGGWVLSVPAADVQALQNGKYTIVTSVDGIGDLVSVDHDIVVDTTAPTITIDPVAENGIIDAAELTEAVTISGTTTGLAGGENIYVILNGWKYTGKVAADGSWSLDIPKAYAEELENGTHRLTANVSDASGNTARSFVDVSVQGHSGIVSVGEDFQGTWDEEDPSVIDMVAGDSYTLKSGLTMTGIQNGVIEEGTAVKEQYVFNISGTGYYWGEGTGDLVTHVDGGAIGEFSFGRQVNSVSFLYAAVDRDCYVEIYDADGHEIDRVRLDGNNTGEPEDNLPVQKFSYEAQEGVEIDHIRINATDEKWGMSVDDFRWTYHDDVAADQHNVTTEAGTSGGLEALAAVAMDDNAVSGSAGNDHLAGTADNDHFTIGNGGGDLLTYHLLNAADATGGNGADRVAGFTVGSGADADRIDLRELLADTSYSAEGKPDVEALAEFLKVTVKGNDTEIAIDRDGAGKAHEMTTLVTLSDVQTDLATLLANHQLVV